MIYLKTRHIFKICNIYLKPDFTFDNLNFDLYSGFK